MHAGLLCVHSSTSITPMLLGVKVASAAALAISDFMCVTIISVNNYIAQHELSPAPVTFMALLTDPFLRLMNPPSLLSFSWRPSTTKLLL